MRETEFKINPHSGEIVVRGADPALLTTLVTQLGRGVDLDCGECPPQVTGQGEIAIPEKPVLVRVAGFVYQSMVDGPGLRSVLFMQGCHIRCSADCRNSYAQDFRGGTLMTVEAVLAELLRPDLPRDGISISGGEPLAQAQACAELVARLNTAGMHVTIYTGYTFEKLARSNDPAIRRVLALADVMVDGPYVATLHGRGLACRGSSNQRVIDLPATRTAGKLRLLQVD